MSARASASGTQGMCSTRPAKPSERTKASSVSTSGPRPTMRSFRSGRPRVFTSARNARSTWSKPLLGTMRPTTSRSHSICGSPAGRSTARSRYSDGSTWMRSSGTPQPRNSSGSSPPFTTRKPAARVTAQRT